MVWYCTIYRVRISKKVVFLAPRPTDIHPVTNRTLYYCRCNNIMRVASATKEYLRQRDKNRLLSALKPLSFFSELLRPPTLALTLYPGANKRPSLWRNYDHVGTLLCGPLKLQFRSVSTGINYLDTWIGHNNKREVGAAFDPLPSSSCHLGRRSQSAPVRGPNLPRFLERASPCFANSLPKNPSIHNALANPRPSFPSNAPTIGLGLPSTEYMIFTMRLDRLDTPKSLLQKLDQLSKREHNNRVKVERKTEVSTIPLVLDFSAFHPDGSPHYNPPAVDTLSGFVNAIRSRGDSSRQSCDNGLVYLLVGVTNLPPADKQCQGNTAHMRREAQLLNVPILSNSASQQHLSKPQNQPNPLPAIDSGASKNFGMITKRKKRGGVAPLLRPRRQGVDSTSTLISAREDRPTHMTSGSRKRTRFGGDSGLEENSVNNAIHSMVASKSATKVHKGSVRSGQTVSTDEPNQSLIVLGSVNPGGEILSEGDIYVFGKLKGRVLAGLGVKRSYDFYESVGDEDEPSATMADNTEIRKTSVRPGNKIIATSFDPELVCIGDNFTTVDDVNELGLDGVGPAMVTLDDESGELVFERIVV